MKKFTRSVLAILLVLALTLPVGTVSFPIAAAGPLSEMQYLLAPYNAFSGEELHDGYLKTTIYDTAAVSELLAACEYYPGGVTTSTTHSGKDVMSLAASVGVNVSYSRDASLGIDKLFSIGVSKKFSIDANYAYNKATETYFFDFEVVRPVGTYVFNRNRLDLLKEHLDADFSDALTGVNTAYSDPATFFATYGTHFVGAYKMGGKAGTYSSTSSLNEGHDVSLELAYSSTPTGSVEDSGIKLGFGRSLEITGNIEANYKTGNYRSVSSTYSYGGNAVINTTTDASAISSAYTTWANSFVNNGENWNCRILTDNDLVMYPIWELLPEGERKVELYNAYMEMSLAQDVSFFDTYVYHIPENNAPDYTGYTILTTAEQLSSIRNKLNGNYVLACDIDLSGVENWDPIGSAAAPFTGILDGNGNSITGMNVTQCVDSAAGLIAYNNGTVKNLSVGGSVTVQAAADVAWLGGIVGFNQGTISDCRNQVEVNGSMTLTAQEQYEEGEQGEDSGISVLESEISNPVIYDLRSNGTPQTITVDDVKAIKLIGSPGTVYNGINIVVRDRAYPAYIILENANIVGTSSSGTISNNGQCARNLFVISNGTANSIGNAAYAPGISVQNADLFILGEANLSVSGGDGETGADGTVSGEPGSIGGDGAHAVSAKNVSVDTEGELTLQGGNGGNGGNGERGRDGAAGANGAKTTNGAAGSSDGIGKNAPSSYDAGGPSWGGLGRSGGNGKEALLLSADGKITVFGGSVLVKTGNGGNGGNGGDGGNGGAGGNGSIGETWALILIERWSWRGGNGTYGAEGGNGGNGGTAGVAFSLDKAVIKSGSLLSFSGKAGNGGNGGKGGNGGNGGSAGSADNPKNAGGTPGDQYEGVSGNPGNGAKGGDGGSGYVSGSAGLPGSRGNLGFSWCAAPANNAQDGALGTVRSKVICDVVLLAKTPSREYKVIQKDGSILTWKTAEAAAQAESSTDPKYYLLSINSEAEQLIVDRLTGSLDDCAYWIGLHRKGTGDDTNKWEWSDGRRFYLPDGVECLESAGKWTYGNGYEAIDSGSEYTVGETVVYTNWSSGEPNNANTGEPYVQMNSDGLWNDNSETVGFSGYILEKNTASASANTFQINTLVTGGICGYNTAGASVIACYGNGVVKIDGISALQSSATAVSGGICGLNAGLIRDCYNDGAITAKSTTQSMDLYAEAYAQNIAWSINDGVISNSDGSGVVVTSASSPNGLTTRENDDSEYDETVTAKALTADLWNNTQRVSISKVIKTEYAIFDTFNEATVSVFTGETSSPDCVFRSNFSRAGATNVVVKNGDNIRYIPVTVQAPTPQVLSVLRQPKSEYIVGDSISLKGLVLELQYSDGRLYQLTENSEKITVITPAVNQIGTFPVTIEYQIDDLSTLSCAYDVSFVALSVIGIQIKQTPDKMTYYQGESLVTAGLSVEKVFNDGSVQALSISDLAFSYDFSSAGTNTVTVSYSEFEATFVCTVKKRDAISGTVTILGVNQVGQSLTVDLSALTPVDATVSCMWRRNGVAIATGDSYTTVVADIGQTITVTVSGTGNYEGTLVSAGVVITAAPTARPAAPQTVSVTDTTVTLAATAGYEYRCGEGAWQASNVFSGLSPNTAYTFYQKISATDTTLESTSSEALSVTTEKTAIGGTVTITGTTAQGDVLTANLSAVTPSGAAVSYQWNRAGTAIAGATAATYTIAAADLGQTITVTVSGSGVYTGSLTSAAVTPPAVVTTDARLTIGTVTAQAGDTVEITFTITDLAEASAISLSDFVYDTDKLQIVSGTWKLTGATLSNWSAAEQLAALAYTENTDVNTTVFTLKMKILDGTADGEISVSCSASISQKQASGGSAALPIVVVPGCVVVTSYPRGDVNCDNYVDSDDAIYLLWHSLLPSRYPIEQNGDMNGDGYVDSDDAIYLLWHSLLPTRYPLNTQY